MELSIKNVDVPEKAVAATNVAVNIERVRQWSQRGEPKPFTPIYQNTPHSDNPPPESGVTLDHGWREEPVSAWDTVGIYLGNGVVLVVGKG